MSASFLLLIMHVFHIVVSVTSEIGTINQVLSEQTQKLLFVTDHSEWRQ